MSENFSLPSQESLEALELAVSRNNTSVVGGTRVGEIQNPAVRSMVEQQLATEQPVLFANLVELGSTVDWGGIVAAERHARQELEAAAELLTEARASADDQLASLEQSVILGIELTPSIEDEIRKTADAQRQGVEQDLILPAKELETEKAHLYAQVEEVFMRAGQSWSIPNLVEIPREIAPGRYPAEEPVPDPYSGPSAALLAETGLTLSERDQRMLDVILSAVSPGTQFRHANVDAELANLGIFDRRNQQQHAFGRLALRLTEAGILEPLGRKGGRSYVLLKGLVPHPTEEAPAPEPAAPSQQDSPESEAEQPPKFTYLKSVGGSRKGFALAEGTFDEMGKRIGGKDRQLAPYLEKWITCLFDDPRAVSAISLVSNSPAVRVTVGENVQTAKLYSFAPKDIEGLEVGPYKRKRIILALLADNQMAIKKVIDQHEMDSGRYSSRRI